MAKKFKVKTKDKIVDKVLLFFINIFKRKPKIINLSGAPIDKKSIMIGNHNGAGGPFTYRVYVKHRFMSWGAHPMCESIRSRRKYLYEIFYRQKLGYSKFKSRILSFLISYLSKIGYPFVGILPIYYDDRIRLTYKHSIECLEKDVSIMIFPENSDKGYLEFIESFFAGFLQLSKLYYRRYKVDLPIYTLYYRKNPKRILIGKPMYLQALLKDHSENEVLEIFRNYMNELALLSKQDLEAIEKNIQAPCERAD